MQVISDSSQFNIKNWWLHLISGILFIIAGIVILANPLASFLFISIFFSVSLFISGVLEIIFALANRNNIPNWGWNVITGIIDLLMGFILVSYPVLSLAIIPFILGFWLLFRGGALMSFSFLLRNLHVHQWGWFLGGGIILSLFSVYIILNPMLGAFTMIVLVSVGFLLTGLSDIAFSLRLRQPPAKEEYQPFRYSKPRPHHF